jgi:hypothetical protein
MHVKYTVNPEFWQSFLFVKLPKHFALIYFCTSHDHPCHELILALCYLFQLTLSVLGHMAAIVRRPFSGNFTRSETHAVKVNIACSPP